MRRGLLLSLVLHAVLALALVAGTSLWPGQGLKSPAVLAEVELVVQNTPAVGSAGPPATSGREASEPAAPPVAAPSALATPKEAAKPSPLPFPPPAAPARPPLVPAPPSSARRIAATGSAPPPAPSVRLGHPAAAGTGLVTGRQVIPAALDPAAQNVPPPYPPLAVRNGEEGSVILRVHVAADGTATAVDVFHTSGFRLLDRAAQKAVAGWHFVPAREAGLPVSSTMLVKIRFVLTTTEGGS